MAGKINPKQFAQAGAASGQVMAYDGVVGEWVPSPSLSVSVWQGVRYYAVDYDSGSDTNLGYSDTSMALAGVVALKTLERLRAIFPKIGNGQKAVVAIKTRAGGATYRNIADTADDNLDFLGGVYGYNHLLVRGTDTIASAGAVAFANDLADKIACGARLVAGTNAAGYNPAGVPTTSVFDCVLAGGGAPGLAAEPALIGKRIRFDAATTTVALRNVCQNIHANDTDTITVGTNLPAVPVATDVFYIEEPGVAVARIVASSSNPQSSAQPPSFQLQGIHIVGIRTLATTGLCIQFRGATAGVLLAFCETPTTPNLLSTSVSNVVDFRMVPSYQTEDATPLSILVGTSLRCDGFTVSGAINFSGTNYACISFRPQVLNVTQFSFGSASYAATGALVQGSGMGGVPTTAVGGSSIGPLGSATNRRYRCVGGFSGSCIALNFSNALIYGVDATLLGALAVIGVNAIGARVSVHDVVGSTGNTGVGLNLLTARDCQIIMGTLAANTFTGAAGQDIQGGGTVFYVHADYARTDLRDAFGNHVQGAGNSFLALPVILANNAVAAIIQYAVDRVTAAGAVQAALATTAAGATGVVGVSQSPFTAAPVQNAMHAVAGTTWIQFDAVPVVGNMAYLSVTTAGNARDTTPPVAATNQKLRLGRILRVSGTLGQVAWNPDPLPVLADGAA